MQTRNHCNIFLLCFLSLSVWKVFFVFRTYFKPPPDILAGRQFIQFKTPSHHMQYSAYTLERVLYQNFVANSSELSQTTRKLDSGPSFFKPRFLFRKKWSTSFHFQEWNFLLLESDPSLKKGKKIWEAFTNIYVFNILRQFFFIFYPQYLFKSLCFYMFMSMRIKIYFECVSQIN